MVNYAWHLLPYNMVQLSHWQSLYTVHEEGRLPALTPSLKEGRIGRYARWLTSCNYYICENCPKGRKKILALQIYTFINPFTDTVLSKHNVLLQGFREGRTPRTLCIDKGESPGEADREPLRCLMRISHSQEGVEPPLFELGLDSV